MCLLLKLLTLAVFTTCLTFAAPQTPNTLNDQSKDDSIGPFDIYVKNDVKADDDDKLISYDPIESRPHTYKSLSSVEKMLAGGLNLERKFTPKQKQKQQQERENLAVSASTAEEVPESSNVDKFSSIAHNSREVRLIGPNQKEVEMKDDLATKVVVALDNLSKEATDVWGQVNEKLDKGWKDIKRSEVWGQVNDKLDKGWKDLKTMVEGVVAPSSSSPSRPIQP